MGSIVTFSDRALPAKQFEDMVFGEIKTMGFRLALNGTEHTHPDFTSFIRNSRDRTSLCIRYQPDGVICDQNEAPATAYIEAKLSLFIERDAFKTYYKLCDAGSLVVVVVGNKAVNNTINILGFNNVSALDFVDNDSINYYKSDDSYYEWPIVNGWICPREHPAFQRAKRDGFKGSGTPFRKIDVKCLRKWKDFKQSMNETFVQIRSKLKTEDYDYGRLQNDTQ